MPVVGFDESGNTGGDLSVADQPLFCLGSTHFLPEHVAAAEQLFARVKTTEWKYSKIKKNPAQVAWVVKFLEQDWVTSQTVKIYVVHKRFMAMTKLVDLIHEPLAHVQGIDLYERGGALAIANLLCTILPMYLGETRYQRILCTFVSCVRNPTDQSVDALRKEAGKAHEFLNKKRPGSHGGFLAPVIIACQNPEAFLQHLDSRALDPIIPAYYRLVDDWGEELGTNFEILGDDSKALTSEMERLMTLADPKIIEHFVHGTGGSKTRYPLRVEKVTPVSSHNSRLVQLADLMAGVANHAISPAALKRKAEPVEERLRKLIFEKKLLSGGIWPSSDIAPEDLGAENVVGENVVDYTARILRGDPTTKLPN